MTPVGGGGHLVYASTSARDPPRCVFVWVGMCACMRMWVHARKRVNTCVCVCARAPASVNASVRAHACRRLYECEVFVFQCASVSLCFV